MIIYDYENIASHRLISVGRLILEQEAFKNMANTII